ncbi:MAG: DUF305 domain-containing protein [Methanobacterium sp.]|jgi:uncharacterized protein (DUF305 family)
MKENEKLVVVGVVIVALITFLALFSMYWNYYPMMGGQNGQTGQGMMENIDRHFIEQMIPHHEEAVAMADIALIKAKHPEIKQLARNIKSSQSIEITKMRQWYKARYGTDVPANSSMMGNMTDLDDLKNAKPFDKEFIEEMIPHHQMAIMMSQMVLYHSNDPEIRVLAESIIKTQRVEIEEMGKWYKEWYGTDVPASGVIGSNGGMMHGGMMNA